MTRELPMTAPAEVYRDRRAKLAKELRRPILVFAGHAQARNYAANAHPFRAGSTYLYLGGPPIQDAAWLIEPLSDGDHGCTLLKPVAEPDDVIWVGESTSDEQVAEAAGINKSRIAASDTIEPVLAGRSTAFICPPCPRSLELARSLESAESAAPDELLAVVDLRLVKDEHELHAMRRAADVGAQAHLAAMRATVPGASESAAAAALLAVLTANCCVPSFSPIVTVDGQVLHSESYAGRLDAGRLLLVDAGAEEPGGYASDITRTYPVTGEFTAVQRQLYDTVLRAETEAIRECKPGIRYRDIHDHTGRVICEGLVDAGLLRGCPAELAERGVHTLFFVHGLGHLIGLDVHDMEDFGDLAGYAPGRCRREEFGHKFLRLDRDLEEDMTVTIEPGIYLIEELWKREDLVGQFKDVVNMPAVEKLIESNFGGIRIEDTIRIRADDQEPEVLTGALPTEPEELSEIISGSR